MKPCFWKSDGLDFKYLQKDKKKKKEKKSLLPACLPAHTCPRLSGVTGNRKLQAYPPCPGCLLLHQRTQCAPNLTVRETSDWTGYFNLTV